MSRSFRLPFAAITGTASAKEDKRFAHRGERRKQSLALKTCADYENFILPHRLECSSNSVYHWDRDGAKRDFSHWRDSEMERARRYYLKLRRK